MFQFQVSKIKTAHVPVEPRRLFESRRIRVFAVTAALLVATMAFGPLRATASGSNFSVLHTFGGVGSPASDGVNPWGSLVQGTDGFFYGTTYTGGTANQGTVFRMTQGGVVTILHSFGDGSATGDGALPFGRLIQGADGRFYGTTTYGGSSAATNPWSGFGTIFRITKAGVVKILHSFGDGSVTNDGRFPQGGLITGKFGDYYGVTEEGGSTAGQGPDGIGFGVAYRVTPAGDVTILHSFGDGTVANDGLSPQAGLTLGSDTMYYGTTYFGGATASSASPGSGVVFRMTASGAVTVLHSFGDGKVASDGAWPQAGLVQGTDGNSYGTTQSGGSAGAGAVFRINTAGTLVILHSFGDGTVANDGAQPQANLVQAADGSFYGLAQNGGTADEGALFKVTSAGAVTILHSFGDGSVAGDGALPSTGLVQSAGGALYGATLSGGTTNLGVVYKIKI